MAYRVSIHLYPNLGGLGWVVVGEYRTMKEAQRHRAELLANGHSPRRVRCG